jgi:hypothetical protein
VQATVVVLQQRIRKLESELRDTHVMASDAERDLQACEEELLAATQAKQRVESDQTIERER